MSPDRFTLENLFAMQLHRYQNIVEEIITNAVKELETERGVKKIDDVWKGMQFVIKHVKRNDDRCFVMGPMDDILVVLDDN
jgi:dynein heavy chain